MSVEKYTHRNGEEEPPVEEGWYWFEGRKWAHSRDVFWQGVVRVWITPSGETRTKVGSWSSSAVYALTGQWWGPAAPPWEKINA